jgi:NADH-quinone oxidoreductase subunit G
MTEVTEQTTKKMINLTIDKIKVTVPDGTYVVDAAKIAGIEIPVFCYHPKMEPVGMCRVCLVDIGLPLRDRGTGELTLDEKGRVQIQFGRTLQTGCNVPVAEGMVVVGYSEKVKKARQDILEFLLTSHPLDCPICDKGGECPLQNLTVGFGSSDSRFYFDDKQQLGKKVPLGELIFLDQERCIHCARCIRFQDDIVGDPVIDFMNRGRTQRIVTYSEPGFDSYWSGNTTDICPVGALTTADFRFAARPWEMKASASLCVLCPVNCNTTINTRREAKSKGEEVIKRIMPRQNEKVNEIWICDKGRFGYHFTDKENRLLKPMLRVDGKLKPVSWEKALEVAAEKIGEAGEDFLIVSSGHISNEDMFNLKSLSDNLGGKIVLDSGMGGGEEVMKLGAGKDHNFGMLGAGDVVLVVASDLEEEAPIWNLRLRGAAKRGAEIINISARPSKTDQFASQSIRIKFGQESAVIAAITAVGSAKKPDQGALVKKLTSDSEIKAVGETVGNAKKLVVIYGSDGLGLQTSNELAVACANLLISKGHSGSLIAAWDKGNVMGAWEMGIHPVEDLEAEFKNAKTALIVGADPGKSAKKAKFTIVQDVRLSKTAKEADLVLPVLAFLERAGSYTSGERRVQRYYPALPAIDELKADYELTAEIAQKLDIELGTSAVEIFEEVAKTNPAYEGLTYKKLAEVEEQWPIMDRDDLYYGGTSYENTQGMGQVLSSAVERGENAPLSFFKPEPAFKIKGMGAVPVRVLYNRRGALSEAEVLSPRIEKPFVEMNSADVEKLGLGDKAKLMLESGKYKVILKVNDGVPKGIVLVPRGFGISLNKIEAVEIEKA